MTCLLNTNGLVCCIESIAFCIVSMFTDIICCFVELIENPPWTARTSRGQTVKFIDGKWQQIEDSELMKLTKLEGQVWQLKNS